MSSAPLLSIVTPSFNQSQFLGQALESVRSQAYPSVEHLVLDGGSSDDSEEVLRRFSQSHPHPSLWWRSSPDSGQSAALNEGFAKASGDIIGWLNADDRYRPGCFEAVADTFAANPHVDILYGDYTFIDPRGEHLSLRREIAFNRFVLRYHKVLYIPTVSTFFRRRIFDDGHFLSTSLHYAMDLEFFLRLLDLGYKFHHMSEVLADFRIHPSSKSVAFRSHQQAEHRSIVLQSTPLAHHFRSPQMRGIAADFLQMPAAILRYSEKFLRGAYRPFLPHTSALPSIQQEQL